MLSLDEANRVAFNYLTFEVNRYVLNLKREQALGLGISNEFYDKMQKDVRETNQFLSAYILQQNTKNNRSGNLQASIQDALKTAYLPERLDSMDNVDGRGSIPDNRPIYFTMDVPVDATNIQFNVYTHSVIGWGQVTMSNGYGYASNTAFQLFGWGGECNVAPPVSGVPYQVSIQVSSGDGGSSSYYFVIDSTRPTHYNLGYE